MGAGETRGGARGIEAESEATLIERARAGERGAYGELWRRHHDAALHTARPLAHADAEDAVAEAFASIWRQLQAGGGPHHHFRAYLFTVVRNIAARWYEQHRRVLVGLAGDGASSGGAVGGAGGGGSSGPRGAEPAACAAEDPAERADERRIVARAFVSLPERWQRILWWSEVERVPRARIAERLGIAPNAVSVLARRAREGLRLAWMRQLLPAPELVEHPEIVDLLPRHVRGLLGAERQLSVGRHLGVCAECRRLGLELRERTPRVEAVLRRGGIGAIAGIGVVSGAAAGTGGGAAVGAAARWAAPILGWARRLVPALPSAGSAGAAGTAVTAALATVAVAASAGLAAVGIGLVGAGGGIEAARSGTSGEPSGTEGRVVAGAEKGAASGDGADNADGTADGDAERGRTGDAEERDDERDEVEPAPPAIPSAADPIEAPEARPTVPPDQVNGVPELPPANRDDAPEPGGGASDPDPDPAPEPLPGDGTAAAPFTLEVVAESGGAFAPVLGGTAPPAASADPGPPGVEVEVSGRGLAVAVGDDGAWQADLAVLDLPAGPHEALARLVVAGQVRGEARVGFELLTPEVRPSGRLADFVELRGLPIAVRGLPGAEACVLMSWGREIRVALDAAGRGTARLPYDVGLAPTVRSAYCSGDRRGATAEHRLRFTVHLDPDAALRADATRPG